MSSRPDRRLRRIAATLGGAVWLAYVTTAGGMMGTGDAVAMFEAASSLIDHGTLDVPRDQSSDAWQGLDGRYYTPFGIGQSLFDVPFVLAGRAATSLTGIRLGNEDVIPKAFVAAASTIPAAVAVAFGLLLSWRLSASARSSVLAALVLAFGTLLWPYAKFGFNAALTAGALTAGVYGIAAGAIDRRGWVAAGGGAGLGLAILTRHEMMIAAFAALGWFVWQVRRSKSARQLIVAATVPVCVALGLWMTLNAMRFGSVWQTGHNPGFGISGFRAFAISPSGALMLYAPPVVAGLALIRLLRSGVAISGLLLLVVTVMAAFYAVLEDWLGTRSYGPRYLVPLVPLLVSPLAVWLVRARTRGHRLAISALCVVGVLVQLPAVAVDFSRAGIEAGQPPQSVRRDDWRWAPLRVNASATLPAVTATVRAFATDTPGAQSGPTGSDSLADRLPLGLDFWWVHLFRLGVLPRAAAILAGLVPLIVAVWLGSRALANATRLDAERGPKVSGA